MIHEVLHYLRPRAGRFTSRQIKRVAELLNPPGYFLLGPVLILVDLPARFQKQETPPATFDLAAHLAQINRQILSN